MDNVRLIKSYVWHADKCYFVSTIDRDSSSIHGGRFSETLVWEYDWDGRKRSERIVAMDGAPEGWIGTHLKLCQRIFDTGSVENTEDGES